MQIESTREIWWLQSHDLVFFAFPICLICSRLPSSGVSKTQSKFAKEMFTLLEKEKTRAEEYRGTCSVVYVGLGWAVRHYFSQKREQEDRRTSLEVSSKMWRDIQVTRVVKTEARHSFQASSEPYLQLFSPSQQCNYYPCICLIASTGFVLHPIIVIKKAVFVICKSSICK